MRYIRPFVSGQALIALAAFSSTYSGELYADGVWTQKYKLEHFTKELGLGAGTNDPLFQEYGSTVAIRKEGGVIVAVAPRRGSSVTQSSGQGYQSTSDRSFRAVHVYRLSDSNPSFPALALRTGDFTPAQIVGDPPGGVANALIRNNTSNRFGAAVALRYDGATGKVILQIGDPAFDLVLRQPWELGFLKVEESGRLWAA